MMIFASARLQKNSLTSTLTLAATIALGLLFVLLLQIVEGPMDHAPATMAPAAMNGLMIYFGGAIHAAHGGARRGE